MDSTFREPALHHLPCRARSKVVATAIPKSVNREQELEQVAMLLALRSGGLGAVIRSLDKFKETPEVTFAIKCGGVENAKAVLNAIQAKVDASSEFG
jgi:hypothetical protein